MSFTGVSLPSPWNYNLEQIDRNSSTFWEQRIWQRDPIRLQSMETWREMRRLLDRITNELVPRAKTLTPVEIFLLHAATGIYEMGWQTPYSMQLPLKKRYIESGCLIRNSSQPKTNLELSYLEVTTINALACICSAPGLENLSYLPISQEPVGQGETASLRYLSALFQLADYLFIRRANRRTMPNLVNPKILDPLNARLLLQPYLPFVSIQSDGVTAFFELHPDDEYLATKMNALFEDPICIWWERNSSWLKERFQFSFILHPPQVKIIRNAAAPDPLARTCEMLITFLEQYTPQFFPGNLVSEEELSGSTIVETPTSITSASTIAKEIAIELAPGNTKRTRAFISYSHKDQKYLEELRIHLKPYDVDVWDATQIAVGADWREEIKRALYTTRVAIMLVSADFMASDFIVKNELPPLLTAAEQEGAIIMSVIIGPSAFKRSPLEKFKTVNSPDKPLKLMRRSGEREVVWNRVAELVKNALSKSQ